MLTSVDDLQIAVLDLPASERALLLERLILSLDADPDIQKAWIDEAKRRDAELQSGDVLPVSGAAAVARVRAGLT